MDELIVHGPCKLSGSVHVSRSKNAYLPIMVATLLNPHPVHLKNLPDLRDIRTTLKLLQNLGVKVDKHGDITTIDAGNITSMEATYELVKTMRASILVLGPLLARFGDCKVSLPGGCAIGARPIDIHLKNLTAMGAEINLEGGYVHAQGKLKGAHLALSFPSVGATENLMMAATLAEGETIIDNSALEPEIEDLANFLVAMGADIKGIGSSKITVKGPTDFRTVEYEAMADRIEAATYIMAGLVTHSEIKVEGFNPAHIEIVLNSLRSMGCHFEVGEDYVITKTSHCIGGKVDTAPYPGFPTDLQAQMMTLMSCAHGASVVTEHIFENRFMHVPELMRMGSEIILRGNTAFIVGSGKLKAAPVMCTDLRASAALVLAALAAEGKSEILRVYHLDRGYEKIDEKLRALGANIERINPSKM
jgi:UDP-N-acetylglucosamine 1-carboxyvinyltransferase